MRSKELKLADDIANATEDHWFNPAIMAHVLSNQPFYTVDRIMELISYILKYNSKRYKAEFEHGQTSEGLFLANELNTHLSILSKQYKWEHLSLPKETKKIIKGLPDPGSSDSKYSWLHEPYKESPFEANRVL
jgi:hypothetical protein